MFVKRCSAEQKSMVRFPKICSAFFKEKSQQNNINRIFLNRQSAFSDAIKVAVKLQNSFIFSIQHNMVEQTVEEFRII